VFGQKDFQQAVLIKKMASDLNLPVRVEVAPTVREVDGIALSSRNKYLSADERERASSISKALAEAVTSYRSGERDASILRSRVAELIEAAGGIDVEYVEIVSADELEPVEHAGDDTVIAVAARIGATRLIDNVSLARPDPDMERLLQNGAGGL
jgi:pantoate--beta-alanine ligase